MIRTLLASLALGLSLAAMPGSLHAEPVSFKNDIAPLLVNQCLACHGPKKAEGAYRVDTFEHAMAAGDSSQPGFVAKDHDGSEALRRMVSSDIEERMPLDGDPLPAEQIEIIKRWIDEGATFDGPDAKAQLASYVPPPIHPPAPEKYSALLPITAVTFSPDGSQLYVGGYHELTVWNPADGALLKRIGGIGQRTYAIVFRPDGKQIAVACGAPGRHGEVRLLNAETGDLERVLGTTTDAVFDVAYNPAGDRIATAAADAKVRIFDAATGAEQRSIGSHSDWVFAVVWSPDGTKLASASRDKTAKVFDAATGRLLASYTQHNQSVQGVRFHVDGAEILSSGADTKLQRWKIADGQRTAEHNQDGEAFKMAAAGELIFVPSTAKRIRAYKLGDTQQVREFNGAKDWILSVAANEPTKRVAGGTFDGQVIVWNSDDGQQVTAFDATPGYVRPAK